MRFCGQVAFKNASVMCVFSSKSGKTGNNFRSGPKNLDFFPKGLPKPLSMSPKKLVGEGSTSPPPLHIWNMEGKKRDQVTSKARSRY